MPAKKKATKTAMMIALTLLQDERVREQLRKAPSAAKRWAEQRRTEQRRLMSGRHDRRLRKLDPTQRFGQRGLERRLTALQRNVRLAFPDPSAADATAVYRAIDELDRATSISATMPMTKRRTAHARISSELDRLELALVDAVLPA
jgi:hypothetical protein